MDTDNDVRSKPKSFPKAFYIMLCIVVLLICSFILLAVNTNSDVSQRTVLFDNAAVAAEDATCSRIGTQVLIDGGNAVDAAISSLLCLGIINSFSSGIGGGGFMLIREPNGKSTLIDFRETAPSGARTDMFKDLPESASTIGGLSVAVQSEIAGFFYAHQNYGKLEWKKLLQMNVDLARDGFKVTKELARRLVIDQDFISNNAGFAETFMKNGKLLVEGDTLKRENLARTLEIVAENGPDGFYKGPIANQMVDFVKQHGGILTLEDLNDYKVIERPVLRGTFNGKTIITGAAPTSGPVAIQVLNFIESFNDLSNISRDLYFHRFIEACKFGFSSRTVLADPQFVNMVDHINMITNKQYAKALKEMASDVTTYPPEFYRPQFDSPVDNGTTHVSVLDQFGMAVACTSTINLVFGSRLLDLKTGVMFNDHMDDFSQPFKSNSFGLKASKNNYIKPGKRPLSSSIPIIVESEGKAVLVIGASGGTRILTSTLQVLLDVLVFNRTLTEAIDERRLHHQLFPNNVLLEFGVKEKTLKFLQSRNHEIKSLNQSVYLCAVQGISKLNNGSI